MTSEQYSNEQYTVTQPPAEGCTSQRCLTRARAHAAELDAKLVVTKASPA
jgi:hypothetical protein